MPFSYVLRVFAFSLMFTFLDVCQANDVLWNAAKNKNWARVAEYLAKSEVKKALAYVKEGEHSSVGQLIAKADRWAAVLDAMKVNSSSQSSTAKRSLKNRISEFEKSQSTYLAAIEEPEGARVSGQEATTKKQKTQEPQELPNAISVECVPVQGPQPDTDAQSALKKFLTENKGNLCKTMGRYQSVIEKMKSSGEGCSSLFIRALTEFRPSKRSNDGHFQVIMKLLSRYGSLEEVPDEEWNKTFSGHFRNVKRERDEKPEIQSAPTAPTIYDFRGLKRQKEQEEEGAHASASEVVAPISEGVRVSEVPAVSPEKSPQPVIEALCKITDKKQEDSQTTGVHRDATAPQFSIWGEEPYFDFELDPYEQDQGVDTLFLLFSDGSISQPTQMLEPRPEGETIRTVGIGAYEGPPAEVEGVCWNCEKPDCTMLKCFDWRTNK